jgi:broad specificity phosphatase PhoE
MIVLARHGNTFEAGTPAYWVGGKTDLPLVAEGIAQALRLVTYLRAAHIAPKTVVAGPLLRTREFAEVIADAFDCKVAVDVDLTELDYGAWEGLDSSSVVTRFGHAALEAWEARLEWPANGGWGESPEAVTARIRRFLTKAAAFDQPVFACTSNGILRFMRWILDGTTGPAGKVRTGATCVLADYRIGDHVKVDVWDERP